MASRAVWPGSSSTGSGSPSRTSSMPRRMSSWLASHVMSGDGTPDGLIWRAKLP